MPKILTQNRGYLPRLDNMGKWPQVLKLPVGYIKAYSTKPKQTFPLKKQRFAFVQ